MQLRLLILAASICPIACGAQTLRDLLNENHLPTVAFSDQELAHGINGSVIVNENEAVLSYEHVDANNILAGGIHLARFTRGNKKVIRADLALKPDEPCNGGPNGLSFLHDLVIVNLHVSPSAGCLVVLDGKLKILKKFFAFNLYEVAPSEVAVIEDMIHFAPAHPERLLIADLYGPNAQEVYPIKRDVLREAFIAEHKKRMPSQETCTRMNDPCSADFFDEGIDPITTNGKGRFAFIAGLSASHALEENVEPKLEIAREILYIYQRTGAGWLYCEEALDHGEGATVQRAMALQLDDASARCIPGLPVVPDRSTAEFSDIVLK